MLPLAVALGVTLPVTRPIPRTLPPTIAPHRAIGITLSALLRITLSISLSDHRRVAASITLPRGRRRWTARTWPACCGTASIRSLPLRTTRLRAAASSVSIDRVCSSHTRSTSTRCDRVGPIALAIALPVQFPLNASKGIAVGATCGSSSLGSPRSFNGSGPLHRRSTITTTTRHRVAAIRIGSCSLGCRSSLFDSRPASSHSRSACFPRCIGPGPGRCLSPFRSRSAGRHGWILSWGWPANVSSSRRVIRSHRAWRCFWRWSWVATDHRWLRSCWRWSRRTSHSPWRLCSHSRRLCSSPRR